MTIELPRDKLTVAQLIEQLQKLDQDAVVLVSSKQFQNETKMREIGKIQVLEKLIKLETV